MVASRLKKKTRGESEQQPSNTRATQAQASCKKPSALDCGVAQVVATHLTAVMQLLSNDPNLKDYNFEMRSTKCLNTAVMMMYLMLGRSAIEKADKCNSSEIANINWEVKRRHGINIDTQVANKLIASLLRKDQDQTPSNELYYVLMSHTAMKFPSGTPPSGTPQNAEEEESVMFPGHVFVLERNVDSNGNRSYNMYQSYLEHYDFAQHIDGKRDSSQQQQVARSVRDNINVQKKPDGAKIDEADLETHMKVIANGFAKQTWEQEDSDTWSAFTHSKNPEKFNGRDRSGIHICYQVVNVEQCSDQLRTLSQENLDIINEELKEIANENRDRYLAEIWGDPSKTAKNESMIPKQLNKGEMKAELESILKELDSAACKTPSRGGSAKASAALLRVNDGGSVKHASDFLSQAPNKTLLLIHSTMCGHCISSRDSFEDAAKKLVERGTNVVDVNSQSLRDTASKDNLIQRVADSTGMMGVPHFVLLGKNGKVVKVYEGDRSSSDLVSFASK